MRRRLKVGDRVLADAVGGWKRGVVSDVYGNWTCRMYDVQFMTPSGRVTMLYQRRSLRRLTSP